MLWIKNKWMLWKSYYVSAHFNSSYSVTFRLDCILIFPCKHSNVIFLKSSSMNENYFQVYVTFMNKKSRLGWQTPTY